MKALGFAVILAATATGSCKKESEPRAEPSAPPPAAPEAGIADGELKVGAVTLVLERGRVRTAGRRGGWFTSVVDESPKEPVVLEESLKQRWSPAESAHRYREEYRHDRVRWFVCQRDHFVHHSSRSLWCASPRGVRDGAYLAWDDDGDLESVGDYRGGEKHGTWLRMHGGDWCEEVFRRGKALQLCDRASRLLASFEHRVTAGVVEAESVDAWLISRRPILHHCYLKELMLDATLSTQAVVVLRVDQGGQIVDGRASVETEPWPCIARGLARGTVKSTGAATIELSMGFDREVCPVATPDHAGELRWNCPPAGAAGSQ